MSVKDTQRAMFRKLSPYDQERYLDRCSAIEASFIVFGDKSVPNDDQHHGITTRYECPICAQNHSRSQHGLIGRRE